MKSLWSLCIKVNMVQLLSSYNHPSWTSSKQCFSILSLPVSAFTYLCSSYEILISTVILVLLLVILIVSFTFSWELSSTFPLPPQHNRRNLILLLGYYVLRNLLKWLTLIFLLLFWIKFPKSLVFGVLLSTSVSLLSNPQLRAIYHLKLKNFHYRSFSQHLGPLLSLSFCVHWRLSQDIRSLTLIVILRIWLSMWLIHLMCTVLPSPRWLSVVTQGHFITGTLLYF